MNILRIIQRWASEWSWSAGRASHVSNGHQHQVIIHDIRVIVVPDGDHWFAQSLDINYGTGGATIDEAQDNFERGLSLTIKANLDRQGSIDRIMQTPDLESWIPLVQRNGIQFDFSMRETHEVSDCDLPYRRISYSLAKAA